MTKLRLDLLLLEKNLFDSRQKAQAAIMAGIVKVGGKVVDKPGTLIKTEEEITLAKSLTDGFVGRGGLKLQKAIEIFYPSVQERVFLDVGASTGGFTDCLLKSGAAYVYAIDVGYGQLDWSLRQDPRVKVIERCNARYLKPEELYGGQEGKIAGGAVIDVSFISLDKIIPNLLNLLNPEFFIIALIKPQFEAGRESVKKGVVLTEKVHRDVLLKIKDLLNSLDLSLTGLTYSPVKGPSGNIEFLAYIKPVNPAETKEMEIDIDRVIKDAHQSLY